MTAPATDRAPARAVCAAAGSGRFPATGYREAVASAWDALAALYPSASIVVLGPAPQVLPVEETTARVDADLSALAAGRGWWYISPIAQEWITPDNWPPGSPRPWQP